MNRNGKLARWKEYFQEVLNPKGNANVTLGNTERHKEVSIIEDKEIKTNPPSKAEIFNTLQTGQPLKLNTPVPGHFQAFKLLKKGIFLLMFPCCS
jgi:hypothetical protein